MVGPTASYDSKWDTLLFGIMCLVSAMVIVPTCIWRYKHDKKERENSPIHQRFEKAQILEGKVVDEHIYFNRFAESFPEEYILEVELPNGSKRSFGYVCPFMGARGLADKYDMGETVKFRDGFRPGDSY